MLKTLRLTAALGLAAGAVAAQTPAPAGKVKAVGPGVFRADQAGLRFQFAPNQPTFSLLENGKAYAFIKE